jgi:hypothetical protein
MRSAGTGLAALDRPTPAVRLSRVRRELLRCLIPSDREGGQYGRTSLWGSCIASPRRATPRSADRSNESTLLSGACSTFGRARQGSEGFAALDKCGSPFGRDVVANTLPSRTTRMSAVDLVATTMGQANVVAAVETASATWDWPAVSGRRPRAVSRNAPRRKEGATVRASALRHHTRQLTDPPIADGLDQDWDAVITSLSMITQSSQYEDHRFSVHPCSIAATRKEVST